MSLQIMLRDRDYDIILFIYFVLWQGNSNLLEREAELFDVKGKTVDLESKVFVILSNIFKGNLELVNMSILHVNDFVL